MARHNFSLLYTRVLHSEQMTCCHFTNQTRQGMWNNFFSFFFLNKFWSSEILAPVYHQLTFPGFTPHLYPVIIQPFIIKHSSQLPSGYNKSTGTLCSYVIRVRNILYKSRPTRHTVHLNYIVFHNCTVCHYDFKNTAQNFLWIKATWIIVLSFR